MPKKNTSKKPAPKKTAKPAIAKRPNINLLTSMVVLALTLGLVIFQVQYRQDVRSRAQFTNCDVSAQQLQISTQEMNLFNLINAYRKEMGADALAWEQNLNRSASWMSKDMISTGRIGHMDSLGRTEEQRFVQCGVPNTKVYGETVVSGAAQADEILAGWKIDPPDAAIILNKNFTIGAVSMELDSTGNVAYWTFNASGPAPAGSPTAGPSSTSIPIVSEPSLIPSPQCLGAPCPTNPGGNPIFKTTPPPGGISPTQRPTPTDVPGGGGGGGGGGNPQPTTPGGAVDPSGNPILDPSGNPVDPSGNPLDPSGNPLISGTPGAGGIGGGNQGGFIGLLLAFLALIIQFFLSLIGRG